MISIFQMLNTDIEHLFLMFIIFAFIGWVCEEFYVSFANRRFVYRGMLYGPICPIYGFGGIIIVYCLYPWRNSWLILFLASMILTSLLEYASSWILEKMFHAKWWDYSSRKFNIHGRVCLLNSTLFGLLGVAQWHFVEPFVYRLLYMEFLQPYVRTIYIIIALILATDIMLTIRKLVDFNTAMGRLKTFAEQLSERYEGEAWFRSHSLHEMIASVKEKAAVDKTKFNRKLLEAAENYSRRQAVIEDWLKRYPSMKAPEYGTVLDHIRQTVKERKESLKNRLNQLSDKK